LRVRSALTVVSAARIAAVALLTAFTLDAGLVCAAAPAPATTPTPAAAPTPAALGATAGAGAPIPKPPTVNARAYILVDHFSGHVLADEHADDREEPASLTKLMTSYVIFKALKEGRLKLTDPVTISEHAWRSEGSRTFVQVGTSIPAEVLIKGMIVQSGNDATIALAEKVGGTEPAFAQLMNVYAKRIGMKASNFVNSDGLPAPDHYTTARDMSILANALITEFPEYYQWYSLHEYTWNNITQHNRNGLLLRDPTVDGMKTGHTDSAGYCLVTSAKRDGMRLVSVVMGSDSIKAREDASSALLNYGYTFYETGKVKSAGEVLLKARVYKSTEENITLAVPHDIVMTVGRGQIANMKSSAHLLKEPLIAPLAANQPVGELTITDQTGTVVSRIPLTPGKAVPEAGLWTRATDSVRLWFN
jgi:D-alanyl-D-alanine carboxypeptidase (penicillin-binding protein 5/6)